jgi:hypothetical protein
MTNTIKNNIMRRVYYSFALSLVTSGAFLQGLLLGTCVALFGRLTHVASIWSNLSQTALAQVPNFVYQSFLNALKSGEVTTALVVVLMFSLTISFSLKATKLVKSINLKTA